MKDVDSLLRANGENEMSEVLRLLYGDEDNVAEVLCFLGLWASGLC